MCLGIPGKVVEVFGDAGVRMAKVQFGGITKSACLEHVPNAKPGEYVDHINGDRRDNRRANLRLVSNGQNIQRSTKPARAASGYRGVRQVSQGCWIAQITHQYRNHYIGAFPNPEEAAHARDCAALRLFGDKAALNFPRGNDGSA